MEPTDSDPVIWETTDLGTAAYIKSRGVSIHGVRKVSSKGGQFVFMFRDDDCVCRRYQIEFMNSDCRKFDAAVRSLKKLCYDTRESRQRR